MHLKFKANNIYGHGTGNETREIVTNEVSLLSVFCWYYPIIQFKQAQTEVTMHTKHGTSAHSPKNNKDRIENYMVELPITWLALKFWKLYGGVGGSPASVQMNKNTSIRDMYGGVWYFYILYIWKGVILLHTFSAQVHGFTDWSMWQRISNLFKLFEKPAIMWE